MDTGLSTTEIIIILAGVIALAIYFIKRKKNPHVNNPPGPMPIGGPGGHSGGGHPIEE
jgi:LPXTG-motif cell wall-anchored protein